MSEEESGVMTARASNLARVTAITPLPEVSVAVRDELALLDAHADDLAARVIADNTVRGYGAAWRQFTAFCSAFSMTALPAHPEQVRRYVAWMATQHDAHGNPRFTVATVRVHLAAIAYYHLQQGQVDPTSATGVTSLVRGLARVRKTAPKRKRPLLRDDVVRVVAAMAHTVFPDGISAARDTAAIWCGFAGALRRSEVAAMTGAQLEVVSDEGIRFRLGASKTNQDLAQTDVVVFPSGQTPETCPACALQRWLVLVATHDREADPVQRRRALMRQVITTDLTTHVCGAAAIPPLVTTADVATLGPVFRATYRNRQSASIHKTGVSGDALHQMLLRRLAEAGFHQVAQYGFHSLRAGHVTEARRHGATTAQIMRTGRWRRAETVEIYDREFNPKYRSSTGSLGL